MIQEITRRFGAESRQLEEPLWALANCFMAQRKLNESAQCWKRITFLEETWRGKIDLQTARAHLFSAQNFMMMDRVMEAEQSYVEPRSYVVSS